MPDGQAQGGLDRLLGHLDSYFLVAELVAGWRAGLLAAVLAGPGTATEVAQAGRSPPAVHRGVAGPAVRGRPGRPPRRRVHGRARPGARPRPRAARLRPDRAAGDDRDVAAAHARPGPLAGRRARHPPRRLPARVHRPRRPAQTAAVRAVPDRRLAGLGRRAARAPGRRPGGRRRRLRGRPCPGAGRGRVAALALRRLRAGRGRAGAGRRRAAERGLGNLRFERRDATRLGLEGAFDLVLALDTVHDLPDPALALAGIGRALRPGGCWFWSSRPPPAT